MKINVWKNTFLHNKISNSIKKKLFFSSDINNSEYLVLFYFIKVIYAVKFYIHYDVLRKFSYGCSSNKTLSRSRSLILIKMITCKIFDINNF